MEKINIGHDFSKLSDKQVMDLYEKFISNKSFDFLSAGLCAGELVSKRGYIIEDVDGEEKFKKAA